MWPGIPMPLELWHGPTCAFKDYALQLMPRLLVEAKKNLGETGVTKILVATSGDTGKAALAGYAGLPGIRIAVFYPNAGTSEVQRLQMATQEGDNVAVYAVNGNFDDAQTGVKRVFADEDLAQELAAKNEKAFQRKLHQLGPPCTADRFTILAMRSLRSGGYRTGRARQLLCAHRQFRRYPCGLLRQTYGPACGKADLRVQ